MTHLLHQREHLLELGAGEGGCQPGADLAPLWLLGQEEGEGAHLVAPSVALGEPVREAHKVLDENGAHQLQVADEQGRLMEQVDAHHGLVAEALVEVEAAQLQCEGLLEAQDAAQVAEQVRRLDKLHAATLPVDVGAARPYEHSRQDRDDGQQDVRRVHHFRGL